MVVLPRWRKKKKRLIKFETWLIMPKGRGNVIAEDGERRHVFGDRVLETWQPQSKIRAVEQSL